MKIWAGLSWILVLAPWRIHAAATLSDDTLAQLRFEQKLDAQVPGDLWFRDEAGTPVQLARYFSEKPTILVLGYYECPMLCTLVLNGLVESLEDLKWEIGKEFQVLDVSINPRETPALAAAKKRAYLKRYGRSLAAQGWHFLTGDVSQIQALARAVGFQFAYDPASAQYAHPSGFIVLTPQGRVSRYFFGVTFSASEVFAALEGAKQERSGSRIHDLVLLCFHYNPIRGKYGPLIIKSTRVLALATLAALAWLLLHSIRATSVGQTASAGVSPVGGAAAGGPRPGHTPGLPTSAEAPLKPTL